MPEYTKLGQELKDEEFKTWNKPIDDEVKCQDFFLPTLLPGDPEWKRVDGDNTVSYYQGTTKEYYEQYHITMSKNQNIPGQMNLHETHKKNKGESDKDSTFIVNNKTLTWKEDNKLSTPPAGKIIEIVQKIEAYQHKRYKSLILDKRKGKDKRKQIQEIEHKQLFDISIQKIVAGEKSVSESLQAHLVQQFQDINVRVLFMAKKLNKCKVFITKENVPSKLIKQQTEEAINNAIQVWAKTHMMLVQEDEVTSQPKKEIVPTEKSAQETIGTVGGPLGRFKDPKLFDVSAEDTPPQPAELTASSPPIQPLEGDNVATAHTKEKFQKLEGKSSKHLGM